MDLLADEGNSRIEEIASGVVRHIVTEYFTIFYTICIVVGKNSNFIPNLANSLNILFEYNQSNSSKEVFRRSIELGCQAFVISDDVFDTFLQDFHEIHDECVQVFSTKHVIVYSNSLKVDERKFDFNLNSSVVDDLPNILFLGLSTNDENNLNVSLSTTQFIGENQNSANLIKIDEFSLSDTSQIESSLSNLNLFPSKIKNLQGREIVLAIFNYNPYTMWKEVNESKEVANSYEKIQKTPLVIDGTESWVFIQLCKRINCTLLISLDEAGEWGEIFDNRTGNGIIGAVAERRAEVGVGALYSWFHESLFLSLSKFISRTGITCITPKAGLRDPFGTPLLPFTGYLWLSVGISYIFCISAYKLIKSGYSHMDKEKNDENISKIGLDILGIFVLQSVRITSRNQAMLMFFVSTLILGLLLGNSYSSSLASVLTIPQYGKGIDTVEELADSGMIWASTHDAWIFSILLATQKMYLQLLAKFRTMPKEALEQHAYSEDISFSIERLPYGHYAVGEYITEKAVFNYQTLTNDIYYEMCVAMSTKTWPLMSELDDIILEIFESGIQKYVELDVVLRNNNNKIQLAIERSRHKDPPGPIKLTPIHLSGAFILLAIGTSLSTIAFLVEFFSIRYKNKN